MSPHYIEVPCTCKSIITSQLGYKKYSSVYPQESAFKSIHYSNGQTQIHPSPNVSMANLEKNNIFKTFLDASGWYVPRVASKTKPINHSPSLAHSKIWGFPFHGSIYPQIIHLEVSGNRGTPSYHPFFKCGFPILTNQLLGYPHDYGDHQGSAPDIPSMFRRDLLSPLHVSQLQFFDVPWRLSEEAYKNKIQRSGSCKNQMA